MLLAYTAMLYKPSRFRRHNKEAPAGLVTSGFLHCNSFGLSSWTTTTFAEAYKLPQKNKMIPGEKNMCIIMKT